MNSSVGLVWEDTVGKKRKRLDFVVTALQRRFGPKALQRGQQALRPAVTPTSIPTGFAKLDQAIDGSGGIPRGRITEILAAPTTGMTTLALKIIAQAQTTGDLAVYLDLGHNFDPDYAARCEVKLAQLRLVRPPTGAAALEIAYRLLAQRGAGVLIVDATTDLLADPQGTPLLSSALRQLPSVLADSSCALIFLTPLTFGSPMSADNYPSGFALPHYAALRLHLKKEKWIEKQHDVRGYEARVVVLKNQLGRAGHSARIAITFNGVVRGDST